MLKRSTSMTIYIENNTLSKDFTATWLMIKRHKETKLLYFCKTVRDPHKYIGSGSYWKKHLSKHGKLVENIWMQKFDTVDDLIEFATFFSDFFNIVHSKNNYGKKLWANLEIENGITGMPPNTDRGMEFKNKSKINNAGCKNPSYGSKWWNNGEIEVRTKNKPEGPNWVAGRFNLGTKINSTKAKNATIPEGSKNGRYDHRVHTFYNTNTGETVKSTQYDFRISRSYPRKPINNIINGLRKSYDNWIIL
jgi:hypothetical protein